MKRFSLIKIKLDQDLVLLVNVLVGLVYVDGVEILKVGAEVNDENMRALISNGVEFLKEEQCFICEFIPSTLVYTKK